jgi:peptidoglycan DL-endopeptidase LytE
VAPTYTVQPGDTLNEVSRRTGIAVPALIQANQLGDPNALVAGEVLHLPLPAPAMPGMVQGTLRPGSSVPGVIPPAAGPQVATSQAPSPQAANPNVPPMRQASAGPPNVYIVQPGDTPLTIARRFSISPSALLDVNEIPPYQRLSPGQPLVVPGEARTPAASGPASPPPSGTLTGHPGPRSDAIAPVRASVNAGSAVRIALELNGAPYVYGGDGPAGFDCSGFVQYVGSRAGWSLPRDLLGQYNAGWHPERLEPGDLVFFQDTYEPGLSHSGIYLGSGQFIHAISEGRGVGVSSLSEAYYAERWYGATRLP